MALGDVSYENLVVTHLSAAVHEYVLASINASGAMELPELGVGSSPSDFARHHEAYEEANESFWDANERLKALLVRTLSEARQSDEAVQAVSESIRLGYPDGNYSVWLKAVDSDSDTAFGGGENYVVGQAVSKCGFTPDAALELVTRSSTSGHSESLRTCPSTLLLR